MLDYIRKEIYAKIFQNDKEEIGFGDRVVPLSIDAKKEDKDKHAIYEQNQSSLKL